MNLNYRLILASKSPRRQSLLKSLRLEFIVRAKEVDESFSDKMSVDQVAAHLAEKKANAHELQPDELLITADTVVILDNAILGKPSSLDEATEMLSKLSGKTHTVMTGVCLKTNKETKVFSDSTKVTFRRLSTEEIDFYVNTYQPLDKAGAYGIQEWIGKVGIKSIDGDYYNVVGLPLQKLYQHLIAWK